MTIPNLSTVRELFIDSSACLSLYSIGSTADFHSFTAKDGTMKIRTQVTPTIILESKATNGLNLQMTFFVAPNKTQLAGQYRLTRENQEDVTGNLRISTIAKYTIEMTGMSTLDKAPADRSDEITFRLTNQRIPH